MFRLILILWIYYDWDIQLRTRNTLRVVARSFSQHCFQRLVDFFHAFQFLVFFDIIMSVFSIFHCHLFYLPILLDSLFFTHQQIFELWCFKFLVLLFVHFNLPWQVHFLKIGLLNLLSQLLDFSILSWDQFFKIFLLLDLSPVLFQLPLQTFDSWDVFNLILRSNAWRRFFDIRISVFDKFLLLLLQKSYFMMVLLLHLAK